MGTVVQCAYGRYPTGRNPRSGTHDNAQHLRREKGIGLCEVRLSQSAPYPRDRAERSGRQHQGNSKEIGTQHDGRNEQMLSPRHEGDARRELDTNLNLKSIVAAASFPF